MFWDEVEFYTFIPIMYLLCIINKWLNRIFLFIKNYIYKFYYLKIIRVLTKLQQIITNILRFMNILFKKKNMGTKNTKDINIINN